MQLYRYFVSAPYLNGQPGTWVDARNDAEACRKAGVKLGLGDGHVLRACQIGKVGAGRALPEEEAS